MTTAPSALPASPLRVVVADADADTRVLYQRAFNAHGCDVVEAADGRDALVKALVRRPALIVTEIRLPIIDGVALCGILRRDRVTTDVPILVVTAESRAHELDRVRRAGADAVLVKPAAPETILAGAQRLLERSRDLQDRVIAAKTTAAAHIDKAAATLAHAEHQRAERLSARHGRYVTTTPPMPPPALLCPSCDHPLTYDRSHIGGVSAKHAEQWDYFTCAQGCGTFQYRHTTRRVRRVDDRDNV